MVLTNLQLYNLPKNNTGVISSTRGTRTEVNVSFVKSCVMASGSNLEAGKREKLDKSSFQEVRIKG